MVKEIKVEKADLSIPIGREVENYHMTYLKWKTDTDKQTTQFDTKYRKKLSVNNT